MSTSLRVMITAGAAGIGLAIAEAYLREGANVHICDVDVEALNETTELYPEIGGACVDVTDEVAFDQWFDEALDDLGGLDVMVNNAGTSGPTCAIEDMDTDAWRRCIEVCLDAQMYGCRRAVPVMKDQRSGSIINISSGAGLYGYPFRTPYAAAKWAVIGFTKSVAAEVGAFNIRCNAICPGAVSGPRMDRVISAEAKTVGVSEAEVRKKYTSQSSMRRFVEPDEIADMAVFLGSPAAAMVSGQAISVDGNTETYGSE